MAKIKFKVQAGFGIIEVESEDYRDDYVEYCEEERQEPDAEVPAEFVRSKVEGDFEDGTRDLDEALEHVSVSVTLAE